MMKKFTANAEGLADDAVAQNIAKLKALFPELVTEGPEGVTVNVDALKALVDDKTITDAEEKYGLNWHGKRRARQLALTPSTGTLRPCPEESVDWDTTQNLMIEGDNLEVLKLLQKSYAGKVKLIYIDPPYNTGKDFVYPDNFQDNIRNYLELTSQVEGGRQMSSNTEASGRFHTDWLNMMYPRLKLARSLLTQDGLVFVNIDDMEVHNLRHAMNDVFGEENFIANVVWQKKYTRANDAQFFSDNHDHILVFARSRDNAKILLQPRSEDQKAAYSNPDGHPKGLWKATPLHAKSGTDTSPYVFSNGIKWSPPPGTYRRYSDDTMARMDGGNEIWFGPDGKSTPSRKSFLSEVKQGVTPVTIWTHDEVGHNHEANNEVKELVGGGVFDNPKPTRLLRRILQISTTPDNSELVLDFFAGSGTTAHAVMAQNAGDGGKRRCILVQLPEPLDPENRDQKVAAEFCKKLRKPLNIAELTKERLRRAAKKVKEENPMFAGDVGFRIFKLDSTNIKEWEPKSEDLSKTLTDAVEHLKTDRTETDILYEVLLKLGLDLCVAIEKRAIAGKDVHAIGGGVLIACLAEKITAAEVENLGRGIVEWHKALAPAGDTTCVFRDSAFADDVAKTNLAAILEQNGIANVRSL
ncbi:site-specific DNA-methyltransferase [Candidatus Nitrospira nitrificans]|nr:site-specific DNA-methyltransferase [Candidatus Nitrospira nitrificans]